MFVIPAFFVYLYIMKIKVNVHYHTAWGERLRLCIADGRNVDMNCASDGVWMAAFDVPSRTKKLEYRLELLSGDSVLRREWGGGRRIPLDAEATSVVIFDAWRDMPANRAFYTSMFSDVVFAHADSAVPRLHPGEIYVEVEAPTLRSGEVLGISGSSVQLGEWNADRVRRMTHIEGVRWGVVIGGGTMEGMTEYKFVVLDADGNIVRWETGDNRRLPAMDAYGDSVRIVTGARLRDDVVWRGAGVAVPVFSLRSEQSFGVGEFADLRLLADWCERCGQNVIQILPVNDTTMTGTWQDSYPYNANSTFALHPLYIRPSEIGKLRDKKRQAEFDRLGRELNGLPQVDYERVTAAKTEYLRLLYKDYAEKCFASREYKAFIDHNRSWLESYAVFSVLRDRFGLADFSTWGDYSTFDADACARFAKENAEDVGFYCFVQFHLDKQLRAVRDYAHSKGVVLKGDIPIGISRTSVDAWALPHLFIMNSSAGAPPDDFSATGQNWGFPIYNWEEMAKDDYAWWRARFTKMAEYFDAYRIDHILGFFRIWEIPLDAVNALLGEFNPSMPYSEDEIRSCGIDFDRNRDVAHDYSSEDVLWLEYRHKRGYFYPRISPFSTRRFAELPDWQKRAFERLHNDFYYYRHNDFWRDVAERRLSMLIESTPMLTCGEDLGMIPHCVPDVMNRQQILSLEIERMPKSVDTEFAVLPQYPYLSVCTTSTHDMNPIRAWWRENREKTQRYYNFVMNWWGEAPYDATPEVCRDIIERHLQSPSMLAVLPLQDWLSTDGALRCADPESERINIPANPRHYWRYRMHLSLESLLDASDFNHSLADMIVRSGR